MSKAMLSLRYISEISGTVWEITDGSLFSRQIRTRQGRRQDFAKGGADARREMPTPLRSGVWGPLGVIRGP